LLVDDGHKVTIVGTAAEALAQCLEQVFDTAIVDLGLPDMDGMELIRRLHKHSPWTLCIVVTAGGAGRRLEAQSAGALWFLTKPFSYQQLQNIIANPASSEAWRAATEEPSCVLDTLYLARWFKAVGPVNAARAIANFEISSKNYRDAMIFALMAKNVPTALKECHRLSGLLSGFGAIKAAAIVDKIHEEMIKSTDFINNIDLYGVKENIDNAIVDVFYELKEWSTARVA